MVPHMVPISLRQIKNRIPLDLARIQATNKPCYVGSEHCSVLQCGATCGQAWPRSLRAYAFPHIGAMPVSEVTTANVLAIPTPIWHDKPETARQMRQPLSAVMKWAVVMGYRPDNPADDALGRQQTVVQQHAGATPRRGGRRLATVRASSAPVTAKRAFEFLVLTAARSSEVRKATWDEMDLDASAWTIPRRAHEGEAGSPRPAFEPGGSRPCTTYRD